MSRHMIGLVLTVASCGGTKQPAPAEPTTAMMPDECTAKGGEVRGDIGDGKVACAAGETDLGRVNQGIEGAVCCAPPTATP